MKFHIITLAVFGTVWSLYLSATEVNVSGKIIAAPCTVDASINQTLDFGDVKSQTLQTPGTGSPWEAFNLTLSLCPASTSKAIVTFSGTPDIQENTAFAHTGTASGVALQLSSSSVILADKSSLTALVDPSHNAIFPLAARVYSPTGKSSAGTFRSMVQVSMSYQ
ncbi:fimbrial protein [Serratia proteamaculans]|uniref:fimbrial protein n=1 Tax=Serratia proteamaculans TaxID=28151 RepID=UPI001C55C8D3|nr:fimbrial protein [Serratia proteamaculans]WEO87661.1 fimbrial protein [Serratia proteamaculans]